MPKSHVVRAGDCLSSIAYEHGFYAGTLWEHPLNRPLRAARRTINVLAPGDIVIIPDRRQRVEERPSDARHVFRRKGVPAQLHLVVRRDGQPRAAVPFTLVVDGQTSEGVTGPGGEIDLAITPTASSGLLRVGVPGDVDEYDLDLGHLVPVDLLAGVQQRLGNLGFSCGDESGSLGEATRTAICEFQACYGLPVTGEVDAALRDKLIAVHDKT